MQLPTIPPRILLVVRVAQLLFGLTSIALSAASVQLVRNIPRPASGDNILLLVANAVGLLTTAYNIVAYRSKKRNPQGKHRMIPYITESFVLAILLAAFILGAVYTSSGRGACAGGEGEEGDGDEAGNGNVAGNGSPTACSLTKASTSFTAFNFLTFGASLYTVAKGAYDEF